jgi:hypothetical protein
MCAGMPQMLRWHRLLLHSIAKDGSSDEQEEPCRMGQPGQGKSLKEFYPSFHFSAAMKS